MARELTSVEEYRRLLAGGTTEDDLLTTVGTRLTLGRWRWHHIRRADLGLQMGDPGFPDVIAVRDHELIVAELKGPKGSYETGQQEWLESFRGVRTADVFTWRPADLETIERRLR